MDQLTTFQWNKTGRNAELHTHTLIKKLSHTHTHTHMQTHTHTHTHLRTVITKQPSTQICEKNKNKKYTDEP